MQRKSFFCQQLQQRGSDSHNKSSFCDHRCERLRRQKQQKNTTHHQNWYSLFAHLMWDAGLHSQIIIDTAPWLIHILSPCLSDESTGSAWPDWMQCTTLVDRPNPSIGYLDLYAFGSSLIFVFNYFCSAFFLTFKRACWIQIMEFDGPGARIHTICINFK